MVDIYYGRAGTGKTHTLLNALASAQSEAILVVPEQLSMTREIYINSRGLKNIKVFSFSRLANTVFRALGGTAKKHPDSVMTAAAVFLAIERVYPRLAYFKSTAFTHGTVQALMSAFSEFDTNRMTEEVILSIPENEWSARSKAKYRDMFLIYREYKSLWTGEYKAPGDDLTEASALLELSDIFSDTVFAFDGFYGFTPQQQLMTAQIVRQSPHCLFAFATDMQSDIFSPVTQEVKKLCRICEKQDIKPRLYSVGDSSYYHLSPALTAIEKNAFSDNVVKSEKELEGLTVYSASNINDELNFIACKIKNDVLSGKYRYRDVAVVSPAAEDIRFLMASVFEKHGIPAFTDTGRALLSSPLVAFLLSAFDIVNYGFEPEYVFALLKTGLAGISFDDVSILESYVRMWKIRDRGWKEDRWTRNPDGIGGFSKEPDPERLARINAIRDSVYQPLVKFKERVRGKKTCGEILQAVYTLTEDFNVRRNLESCADGFKAAGNVQLYDEYMRVYSVFIDMLDSIYEVARDSMSDSRRFYDMLCICASSSHIAGKPSRTDEVLFAGLGRVRAESKKSVYIPRLNGNMLPSAIPSRSLITEADKRVFNKFDIAVSMDAQAHCARERFDLYCAAMLPSDELTLTYSLFRVSGEALTRSEYLDALQAAAGAKTLTANDLDDEFFLVSVAGATDVLSRTGDKNIKDALTEATGIDAVNTASSNTRLSDSVVEALYSKSLRLSFSGMEEYVSCPFKFFMDRGLKATREEPVDFKPADIGTFIHKGLEDLLSGGFDISTRDNVTCAVNTISDNYYNTELADCAGRSKRFDYLFLRAKTALEGAAQNVAEEIRHSEFKPFAFEVDISQYAPPVALENGYTLTLVGSIDRVDMTEDGFAKIVDYKSGKQPFSYEKIYNGLSMQLPVYASAVRAKIKDVKIAAMYYLKVGMPKIDAAGTDGMDDNEYNEKLQKYYTRDGVFSVDSDILRLDSRGTLFAKVKKDRLITDAQMNELIDFTADRIKKTGLGITSGNADISPICDKNTDACAYCDYSAVCNISEHDEYKRKLMPPAEDFLQ